MHNKRNNFIMQDISPTLKPSLSLADIEKSWAEIEKQLATLFQEKTKFTKLFVAASDNAKKYDEKLKNAKQDFSKAYHQKKVDNYKDESIHFLKFMSFIDNSIKRGKEHLTQLDIEKQKRKEEQKAIEENPVTLLNDIDVTEQLGETIKEE